MNASKLLPPLFLAALFPCSVAAASWLLMSPLPHAGATDDDDDDIPELPDVDLEDSDVDDDE